MNKRIIIASNSFSLLIVIIILFFTANIYAENQGLKRESDSLRIRINQCTDDFCKCNILDQYFWKYGENDPERAKYYGEYLYDEFHNSSFDYLILKANEAKANIFLWEGNIDSANFFLKKTLPLAIKVNDKYSIIQCYQNLATVNEKSGDLKSVIANLKLAEKYASGVPDAASTNYTALKKAYFYDYLGNNNDSALFYFLKALKLSTKKSENLNVIWLSLNVALDYVKQHNFKKSLEYMNIAVNMPEELISKIDVSKSYLILGDFFLNYGNNYDIALNYYKKAISKIKDNNDLSFKGGIYRQMGNLFIKQGMDSSALRYYLLSMDLLKKTNNTTLISGVYKNLGETYKRLAKFDLAILNYKACLHTGFTSFPKIDYYEVFIAIADIYMEINNRKEALAYYQKAVDLTNNYHSGKEAALSKLKIGFYFRSTNLNLNEKYYLSALENAKTINDLSLISNVADSLSHFYQYCHNYKKVNEYNQLIRNISVLNKRDDWLSNMKGFLLVYEFEKIEKEKEASRLLSLEELKRQKIYRNFLILMSGLLCLLGIVVFISYRRKTKDNIQLIKQKEEIEEKNQEIQSQIEEIEKISAKLHEADQMKLRFFSNISHEIRTPLTLIINPLQNLIGSFKGDQEQKRQLDLINNNANRLKELTDQILDLQKLDSGNLKLNLVNADLIVHVKGIISSFEGYCNKTSITLLFVSDFSSLYGLFDKDKITKVLSNLLSNAFKYSNTGGEINVQLTVDNNRLILIVKDKGKGIPKELLEDVFERYYQLETSDIHPEGAGIGLAYVKELTGLMGGKIEIKSEINHGTSVEISIPLSEFKIIEPAPCEIEIRPTSQPVLDSHIQSLMTDENGTENVSSILVVEDNTDLQRFVGELFKDEFKVMYAHNGKEGIKKALHHLPDIIISDIMMPDTDGIVLCSTLKQDEHTSHIPIILLTAKDHYENHVEGYCSGADDYIVKPFDSALLKLKVRNMISTRESVRKQFNVDLGIHSTMPKYSDIDKLFLSKCIDVVNNNIDNSDFTIEDLSKELSFSRRNLYRKIQALTNHNPAELIKNIRMKHAANLLKTTNLRVSEVAQASGYDNTVYFSQLFKKQYGVLPSEYSNKI